MANYNLSVKTGDTVVVISGKDAGKKGKILATSPEKHRVVVEGVNIVAHHKKPRSAQDKGGIVKSEGSIDASNVMIVCPVCGKATRVYHKEVEGKKVRVCKCGATLDKKYEKAVKKADKAVKAEKPAKAEKAVKAEKPVTKAEKTTKIKATSAKTKAEKVTSRAKKGSV